MESSFSSFYNFNCEERNFIEAGQGMKRSATRALKIRLTCRWSLITDAAVALLLFCLAFASTAATANPLEDQQACINDALTVCSQFIPDRERVAGCLLVNRSRISETCRMALTHFNQKIASPAKLSASR
jgi:hypothetical protein